MLKSYLSKLCTLAVMLGMSFGAFSQNVTITSPASIAGDYLSKHAAFGGWLNGQSGELILANDGAGATNGCTIANDMTGKIALIDRGVCGFAVKAINAQNAGAIAVIVCNNNATIPDSTIVMGGANCNITIPAVMLTLNMCNTIKAVLATEAVTAVFPVNYPGDGNGFQAETVLPGAGTHTSPDLTGPSPFTDSDGAKYFTITAPSDAVMNVNSCASGVDTRVTVFEGCRNAVTFIDQNDDACGSVPPDNDPYSSSLDVIVRAGQSYTIVWDNFESSSGFDFEVSFGALPNVDVTFQVDMQDETVAPDGVKISLNGGAEANMTDSGNGIWTYTTSAPAGSAHDYVFLNGSGNEEDSIIQVTCRSVELGLDALTTDLVCYNSCSPCPPDAVCPLWINENFDNYTLGGISDQSDVWDTWTQPTDMNQDAFVTTEQALSGTQALKIAAAIPAANSDDQMLNLGNRTSGHFILKWKMYVPTGSAAYYNMQKNEDTPGTGDAFANEVVFNIDGTGIYNVGNADIAFTYPHGEWFTVVHDMDMDNQINRVWYDGVLVVEHPTTYQAGSTTGISQLGGIDFFGNTGVLYYIDDVTMKQVEACPANALICDGFDAYDAGLVGPQSPWWTGWSNTDGGPDDGEISSVQYLSCEQSLKVSAATPAANSDDIILLLGDRPDGNYSLSWDMYIPTGSLAYFNVQKDASLLPNAATADYMMEVYFNANGAGAVNAGGTNSSTFTYTYDNWFNVQQLIDLDNNTAQLWINGTLIQEYAPSWNISAQADAGYTQLGGVDFYGAANVLYYVDNVLLEALPATPGDVCVGANDLNAYLGGGVGTVVSTPLYDNTAYTTGGSDPATGFECFGEPTGNAAAPELNNTVWYTFIGDGETYNIETGQCGSTNYITDGDTQIAIYSGTCGNLTPVACNEDAPGATAGNYYAGLQLATTEGTVYYMIVDGFSLQGAVSIGEYCIKFTQLTGTPVVDVTFRVNMEREAVSAGGVRIAGSFNGWTDENMTNVGNNIWEITKEMEAGDVIQWKFKNGPNGWESNAALIECGVNDGGNVNRTATIGDVNETLGIYCFNWCVDCDALSANESQFARSVGVNPNPAGSFVNITYNFESMTNLNVRIVNTLGQTLLERKLDNTINGSERFDIASLPSGAYTVVFSNGEQIAAKRLIVE
jgi:PA domain/Secretion system C-terminal sorting domain